MDVHKVRGLLALAVAKDGGAAEFSRKHGLSNGYIGDALANRRDPGPKILNILGLEKIVTYRKVKTNASA